MKKETVVLVALLLMLFSTRSFGQAASKIKFGDISPKDFQQQYAIDTSAQAVILYSAGSAEYDENLDVIYKYHRRIRLLNKNTFPAATVEIPLFRGERGGDEINNFKAATYNIDGGAVTAEKIDKAAIFDDKVTKGFVLRKFTFPALKEGCIIEYSFEIKAAGGPGLRGWSFQDIYPVLQSRYEATIPALTSFVSLKNGYYDLIPETEEDSRLYRGGISSVTTHYTWTLNNLPAMKPESYTTTVKNYISRIEFQLKSIDLPNGRSQPLTMNWNQFSEKLMNNYYFGKGLSEANGWLNDDMQTLVVPGDQEKTARNIFSFVRDNFACNDYSALDLSDYLKTVYHSRKGSVADLNLIMIAMLRKAGINADPVMLSTRDHGYAYDAYPIINKFNYVIASVTIGAHQYLLDAGKKKNGFNRLPGYCYNGYGHMINEDSPEVPLFADSLMETKSTSVFIRNSDDGKVLEGSFNSDLGYFESYKLRETIEKDGTDQYFKNLKTGFTNDISIANAAIDSLKKYDEPVTVHYDFDIKPEGDIMYFNPLVSTGYSANPFTAAKRNYPVEMPYKTDEIIVVNMEIPKGYKVDEMPKSEKFNLNDTEGMFEYLVHADAASIQIRCRLRINKITFDPEDYESLREFYAHIVKKESEQIVFKKN